jgi:hypothetical protein
MRQIEVDHRFERSPRRQVTSERSLVPVKQFESLQVRLVLCRSTSGTMEFNDVRGWPVRFAAQVFEIEANCLLRRAIKGDGTSVEHNTPATEALDRRQIVRNKNNRFRSCTRFRHLAEAFLLEGNVSDRKHFVYDQNLRVQVGGN